MHLLLPYQPALQLFSGASALQQDVTERTQLPSCHHQCPMLDTKAPGLQGSFSTKDTLAQWDTTQMRILLAVTVTLSCVQTSFVLGTPLCKDRQLWVPMALARKMFYSAYSCNCGTVLRAQCCIFQYS